MRSTVILSLALASFATATVASAAVASKPDNMISLHFNDADYLHRWSNADQHEFTPRDQRDLERWVDMVTVNHYRAAQDGDALAATANSVLGTYQANQAIVVRTDSVPRTSEKPAEYLIVVLFPQKEFIEAAFTRFKLVDGVGAAVTYSHRVYGGGVGDQMSAWLQENGPDIEAALMALEKIPAAKKI